MVILNQNVIIYINVQFIFVPVQRTAHTGFRIFLHTRIMVDAAKFESHDSGGQYALKPRAYLHAKF